MTATTQIRISGSGGQGLLLCAAILGSALTVEGKRVARSQSYEPTSRGGLSRSDLVVGEAGDGYPLVTDLDYVVILDQIAVPASEGLIRPDAVVLSDTRKVDAPPQGPFTIMQLPALEIALALGNARVANVVALGALAAVGNLCDWRNLESAVEARFAAHLLPVNLDALRRGRDWAAEQLSALAGVA